MMKKILLSMILIMSLLIASINPVNAQSNTLTITDDINDVFGVFGEEETETNLSRPNVDIYQVICEQDGKDVSLSLKLAPGGVIQNSVTSIYIIGVVTTGGYSYNVVFGETEDGSTKWMVIATPILVEGGERELNCQIAGMNTDTVTVSFSLLKSYEKCISAFAAVREIVSTSGYYGDELYPEFYPVGNLVIDAGGPYTGKKGKTINLTGTIENGDPSDYEWVWVIEETNTVLEGVNVSYTFKVVGNYTGILYAYDSNGNFGMDDFTVDISSPGSSGGSSSNNGGGGTPGFEIIILLASLAIVVLLVTFLLRKK